MPRDISSSSSEDEADAHTASVPEQQNENAKKASRYQCPSDFVSFSHKPCSSTLTESLKNNNNELWLIKAPANFKSESFRNIKVPLSGLQTVKVPTQTGSSQQIYSVLASSHGVSELCLLTSDKPGSNNVVFGPTFSGLLNVCESYGDSSTNQTPQVIPAAPAPSIPPGLKQRFHPFGSKTPTLTSVAESEADGAVLGPSSTTLRPLVVKRFVEETWQEEQGEEGRKKKKKKKEKSVKTECLEVYLEDQVRVKVEPVTEIQEEVMMELPTEEGDVVGEKRKKKRKKKDREREEVEEGIEPSVRVKVEPERVKTEPIDILYGDVMEESGRKKKKKKKNRTDDD
ncbi:CD3e molecule, epsilon associated protein [Cheilinus undulatus]|uniref:CD3e molecule, epsilon associated protein n=1 Tax=Cheilinus undulatus TaxID=241271 RepID=UPI001BD289E7|nr:CD3e molecule, epsilon associated protein [Cheilinus undulatus]